MEEWVEEWFSERKVTVLNIYVLGLVLIEHFDKSKTIQEATNYVLEVLLFQNKIGLNEQAALKEILIQEEETLTGVAEMLFSCSKNPQWLQSQFQTVPAGGKILLARPKNRADLTYGQLKSSI
jgi:hypothetical protein